jgi:hypothetical protein
MDFTKIQRIIEKEESLMKMLREHDRWKRNAENTRAQLDRALQPPTPVAKRTVEIALREAEAFAEATAEDCYPVVLTYDQDMLVFVGSIGYGGSEMIILEGLTEAGEKVRMLRHYSHVSLSMIALKSKGPMGFKKDTGST